MRLLDCFVKLFVYVPSGLDSGVEYGSFRSKITDLIDDARSDARALSINDADFDSALFAVVAWIDESVMCSQWPGAEQWKRATLQMQLFRSSRAGVEFYSRLEALGPNQKPVRELYYMALGCGFRGRFSTVNDEPTIDLLKQQQLGALLDGDTRRAIEGTESLFPAAYPLVSVMPAEKPRRWMLGSLPMALVAGPPVIVLILYLSFSLILGANVRQILAAIH
jgi:type VI secretion system protein ImpK